MIFLIHYNRTTRQLISIAGFEDREMAFKAKLDTELELLSSPNGHEVVLLEAKDQEALMETHRRYFSSLTDIKAGETAAFESSKARFIKYWNVRQDGGAWRVQAEGMPDGRYPSKEAAIAAAAKDSRSWNKATGNPTGVRMWENDEIKLEERFGA